LDIIVFTQSTHQEVRIMKKHLGFGLNIAALALFFPGILFPMFSLNMEMAANLSGSNLGASLIDKELSIMATIDELWHDQRLVVAGLIFLFSVGIPLIKSILVSIAYFMKYSQVEKKLLTVVAHIGKWSMADVFVVAVFLAILSTNHADTSDSHQLSVFGFYYFTGYCLLSLLGTHLAFSSLKEEKKLIPESAESAQT
jgi:uncharacterized paraquat-inducible protein A